MNAIMPNVIMHLQADQSLSRTFIAIHCDVGGRKVVSSVTMQDGDAVVIFNFRADRVVELSKALEYKDFDKFDRKRWPNVSHLAGRPPSSPLCDALPQQFSVHMYPAFALMLRAAPILSLHVCAPLSCIRE